jgi:oligoendopeptidase F
MLKGLPDSYQDFMKLSWNQLEPYTANLLEQPITSDDFDSWLHGWTHISSLITECYFRLQLRTMTHTNDKKNNQRFQDYSENIMPQARMFENQMKEKMIAASIERDDLKIPLRKFRADSEIFRESNLLLETEIETLLTKLQEIEAARMVDWDGEDLTIKQAIDKSLEPERPIREKAWMKITERVRQDRNLIQDIWSQLLDLRLKIAHNAGFEDYRSYQWQKLGRFDYTPDNCKAFNQSILEVVVPLVSKIMDKRKKTLDIESVRVWDTRVDPLGRAPIKPYDSIDDLNYKLEGIFSRIHPEFGDYYHLMVEEGLIDLETRKHKLLVGYMEELPASKRPFIITNASNTIYDIETLLHEGGHSFHMFEAGHWPFHYQSMINHTPVEFVEVGSTALELLALPFLHQDEGGFYSEEDIKRVVIDQLEGYIRFWPYMSIVDSFQHWIYENPEEARDLDNCDKVWFQLFEMYRPHLDWSGIETTCIVWHMQGHIFYDPFYYVEYALAQLGAIQIWINSKKDYRNAVAMYRKALALGNTASLHELFKTAGAKFTFDVETINQAISAIYEEIELLELAK